MAVLAGSIWLANLPHQITAEANARASTSLFPPNAWRPINSPDSASDFARNTVGKAVNNNAIEQLGGKSKQLLIAGDATINAPVAIQSVGAVGSRLITYKDDFYERIHIIPIDIDVGALLTDQTREVEIWNSHIREGSGVGSAQLLASITPANDDGITLIQPAGRSAPTIFAPLESLVYTFSITTEGPPSIGATYVFDWPAGSTPPIADGDLTLTIIGLRVVIFPFPPTWRNEAGVIERIQWLTDVIEAYDGKEQRIRLRAIPRKEYEFEASAFSNKFVEEEAQHLDAIMWGFQARTFGIPVWTDCRILPSALPIGSTIIPVDPANSDFHVGGIGVLFKDVFNTEAFTVKALAGSQIEIVSPAGTITAFNAGDRVYPAHTARMTSEQQISRPFDQMAFGIFNFIVEDTHEVTPVDTTVLFKGDPVLDTGDPQIDRPDRSADITENFRRKAFILDYLTGIRSIDDQTGIGLNLRSFRWTFGDRAQFQTWLEIMYARAGRYQGIWIPSWHDDLLVTQQIGVSDTVVTIRDVDFRNLYQNAGIADRGRNTLMFLLTNGTRVYKRVLGAAIGAPGEEILTLDEQFGVGVLLGEMQKVSFMQKMRMESDTIEVAWTSVNAVRIDTLWRVLKE